MKAMKNKTTAPERPQHSPLPWSVMNSHKPGCRNIVSWGDDERQSRKFICEVAPSDTDDAAFIVQACNCHAQLLQALKTAVAPYLDTVGTSTEPGWLDQARAAIQQAQGGQP